MALTFAPVQTDTIPLYVIDADTYDTWKEAQDDVLRAWLENTDFKPGIGQVALVPNSTGALSCAVVGFGKAPARKRGRFHLAAAAAKLPTKTFEIKAFPEDANVEAELLGWLLSGYRFERYSAGSGDKAQLVFPEDLGTDKHRLETIANAEALTRDLINTPANDMGPDALEAAAKTLADKHGARFKTVTGDDLLDHNYPMIHAVGRASDQAPRLLDMSWGDKGPKLTLVGKGVCFDTGGLNIKPGASMGLMKKDMGGAATVLGLADMIMGSGLSVQLRVLIPAVENAVSGNAFRPGDILTARNGLTVEINNTDAEGRLVLADALALASEDNPDQIISMATLTGAARVAVGPDLSPFYADEDSVATALATAAARVDDPVWRMPFWDPYEKMIEPGIADLDNAPKGGFAGSITAALFLRRFVDTGRYTHFDIYGWQPAAAPARPKGGVGMGSRALFEALPEILDL